MIIKEIIQLVLRLILSCIRSGGGWDKWQLMFYVHHVIHNCRKKIEMFTNTVHEIVCEACKIVNKEWFIVGVAWNMKVIICELQKTYAFYFALRVKRAWIDYYLMIQWISFWYVTLAYELPLITHKKSSEWMILRMKNFFPSFVIFT